MFLPMSCTSPFTVASTIFALRPLPFDRLRACFLHVRQQIGDRMLHRSRALHDLRQEHLAGAEQVADDAHAVHQRPFDHIERSRHCESRFLDVLLDEFHDAVHQRVREPLVHAALAPCEIDRRGFVAVAFDVFGELRRAVRWRPAGG